MSYLRSPLEYNKFPLKNRLVMPPMATAKASEDGSVSDDLLAYYDEKSAGGFLALVIIEHSYISQQGKASVRQLSAADDSILNRLRMLADTIHHNGSKTVMQLNHVGSAANPEVTFLEAVAPSAVVNPAGGSVTPHALSIDEIQKIINDFRDAALRVKQAGFDGVEIHSAHGYLLSQFLSPLTNLRTDSYGGNIRGRCLLHREIIAAVRAAVGDDFPILMRLGAADYMEGGLTIEDSCSAAKLLQKTGLDMLDISGGFCRFTVPGVDKPGFFTPLTTAIKAAVSIPVIVTGGIKCAADAEHILREGYADLIGVGRAIYIDSNWAKQAMSEA